jgi:hypothetical protein
MNACAALLLLACAAQDVRVSGHAGLGGSAVRGDLAPVTVEIENRGPGREIVLALVWALSSHHQPARTDFSALLGRHGPTVRIPVSLPSRSRKIVSTPLVVPDADDLSAWAIVVDPDRKPIAGTELAGRLLPASTRLVAIAGDERPDGLDLPGVQVTWVRPESLPEDWKGYASLEALLWLDASVSDVRGPNAMESLRTWVSSGGHLVVARADRLGVESPALADLLPVRLRGSRELQTLEGFRTLPGIGPPPAGKVAVLESTRLRGRIRLSEGDLPLVVEGAKDAGRVTFVGFDPARPPIARWAGARPFWSWLLGLPLDPRPDSPDDDRPPRLVGSSALAQSAATFPGVAAPGLTGLLVLIGLFLLAVGPLEYGVLRVLRRLELTWVTFPATVAGFTFLILLLGGGFMSRAAIQREIVVVDHYPGSDRCRLRALGALLSPADLSYQVTDAIPVSSQLLPHHVMNDYSEGLTDVSIARSDHDVATRWFLNRGATGLVLADRITKEPPPLEFSWMPETPGSIAVSLRNESGFEWRGWVATPLGVYALGTVPRGRSTTSAPRRPNGYADFQADLRQQWGVVTAYDLEDRRGGASEQDLNTRVSHLLMGASFTQVAPRTGIARGIHDSRFIEAGGSILLAWRASDESLFSIEPRPSKRTTLVFSRIFLEGRNP